MYDINPEDIKNLKSVDTNNSDNSDDIFLFGVDGDQVDVNNYLIAKWNGSVYGVTIYGIGL